MSKLRNAAARSADSLGRSMKAEYAKTQQRARNDGNSQQKSVTAFAEDEVAEKARTSAVAAGQTARQDVRRRRRADREARRTHRRSEYAAKRR